MTLHLNVITRGYAIQVSDRLATTTRFGRQARFNPAMNKNVIFQATDALVSIGASGRAYLEGVPVDQWIAQKMTGQDLTHGAISMTVGGPPEMDLNHAIEDLRANVEEAFRALPARDRLPGQSFAVVGWQRRRRNRAQPILWVVRNSQLAPATFFIERELQARDEWAKQMLTMRPTGILIPDQLEATFEELRGAASPGELERLLVQGVRRIARIQPGVGEDCMVIWIRPDQAPQIAIRFVPRTELRARVLKDGTEAPVVFTPWILPRGGTVFASNFIAGYAGVWEAGGIQWSISSPAFPDAARVGMVMDRWPTPHDPQGRP